MGSGLAKAVGALGRRDCLMMDPKALVLIEDEAHVLFDASVFEPLEPAFVENIRENGVMEPVECRRNGDTLEVVFGRKRVRAAREAGLERIPVLVTGGTDADFFRRMVSENEARKAPSYLTRARNIVTAESLGYDENAIARMFMCSPSQVRNLRAYLDLAPQAQKAVERGLPFTTAVAELAKLPREQQVSALEMLQESGATLKGAAGKANIRNAARGNKPEATAMRMRGRKVLERVLKKIPRDAGDYESGVRDVIRLAMGDNVRKLSGYLE